MLLAEAFLVLGQYREAVEFADEALARYPGNAEALEVRQAAREHLKA